MKLRFGVKREGINNHIIPRDIPIDSGIKAGDISRLI